MSRGNCFFATLLSGAGWVTTSAAAVNAIVSPWFGAHPPGSAFVGLQRVEHLGGVIFSPLRVAAIWLLGFPWGVVMIGLVMIMAVWIFGRRIFCKDTAGHAV